MDALSENNGTNFTKLLNTVEYVEYFVLAIGHHIHTVPQGPSEHLPCKWLVSVKVSLGKKEDNQWKFMSHSLKCPSEDHSWNKPM